MNQLVKKIINAVLSFIFLFVKDERQRARIMSRISRSLFSKHNGLEYDATLKGYWLKHDNTYLFLVNKPYYNFSKNNLNKSIYSIYCKHYEVKPNDVIVDIGAGIGTETLFFYEKAGQGGKFYNIEASTDSYKKLVALCQKNNISNATNFNMAIADFNGTIWMEETEHFEVNQVNKQQKGIEITCVTLDQFVQDNHITRIDLLKVNIEGAELEMISGMQQCIHIIENVAVSCHDFLFKEDKGIRKKMVSFLEANGFEMFYNTTGNQVTDSWIYARRKH